MMGLIGKKVFEMKKVLFKQMNMGAFSKKIFGKIWLSYGQKHIFRGANLFSKVFKNRFIRGKKVTLCYQIYRILCHQSHISHVGTPNLGSSKFKNRFVCHTRFLPLKGVFGHHSIGQWGHFFCIKWLNTITEINLASKTIKET